MELKDLKDILELIICVLGVIIPLVFLIKEHYDKKKRRLAEQVIAYYCLQEEAVAWIRSLDSNAKKVKEDLRNRAQNHKDNVHRTYPNMTLSKASELL